MKRFCIVWLVAFTNCAFAEDATSAIPSQDFPLPPDMPASSAPAAPGFSVDTPIEMLASSPAAANVIRQQLPGLLEDSSYSLFKSMPLKSVAALSGGRISADRLQQIDTQLKAIPIFVASKGR